MNGQQRGIPYFDPYDLKRVWQQVQQIRRNHKGLSLEAMASEVTAVNGIYFHRKYFQRLEKLSLGPQGVLQIVNWIDQKYHRGFKDHLLADPDIHEHSTSTTFTRPLTWRPVDPEIRERLSETSCAFVANLLKSRHTELSFALLPFYAQLVVLKVQNYKTVPSADFFFLSDWSTLHFLDGSREQVLRINQKNELALNAATISDYIYFCVNHIEEFQSVRLVSTPADMIEALSCTEARWRAIATTVIAKHTPPRLLADKLGFVLEIDVFHEAALHRGRFDVAPNGDIRMALLSTLLGAVPDASDEAIAPSAPIVMDFRPPLHSDSLRAALESDLSACETGYSLLYGCLDSGLDVRIIYGKPTRVALLGETAELLIFADDHLERLDVDILLRVVHALRMVEQSLIGFELPPPNLDMAEFASVAHAKNLDAIIFMCRVTHEMLDGPRGNEFRAAIDRLGYGDLYDGYVSGLPNEVLAELYLLTER